MFTTNLLTANWYADFLKHVPDSKLFSLRAVLDAFPAVIGKLPVTILLALGGAFFGIVFAMIFALVKINRVRILYPIQAVFVSFLRGTPLLVQLMLTYYGIPLILKAINLMEQLLTLMLFRLSCSQLWLLPLMRRLMRVRPSGQLFYQWTLVKLRQHVVLG